MGKKQGVIYRFQTKKSAFFGGRKGSKIYRVGVFFIPGWVVFGEKRRFLGATTKTEKRGDATFFRVEVAAAVWQKFEPTYA